MPDSFPKCNEEPIMRRNIYTLSHLKVYSNHFGKDSYEEMGVAIWGDNIY